MIPGEVIFYRFLITSFCTGPSFLRQRAANLGCLSEITKGDLLLQLHASPCSYDIIQLEFRHLF
jgi:hypothetical protein